MKVVFSHSLYAPKAIEAAVQAYEGLAEFSISVSGPDLGSQTEVVISNIHQELKDDLVDAFCNHVLFETIVLHRSSEGGSL